MEDEPDAFFDAKKQKESLNKLKFAVQELVDTERQYVKDLRIIVDGFMPHMQDTRLPSILVGAEYDIFCNTPEMLEFHKTLLADLEFFVADENPSDACLQFIRHEERFWIYFEYCKNKKVSDDRLRQFGGTFFTDIKRKLDLQLDLNAYLLTPVQRIQRYRMLLENILKYATRASPEIVPDLQRSLKCVSRIPRLADIAIDFSLVTGLPPELAGIDDKRFLLAGDFQVWGGKSRSRKSSKSKDLHVFLHHDALILTKKKEPSALSKDEGFVFKSFIKADEITPAQEVPADKSDKHHRLKFTMAVGRTPSAANQFIFQALTTDVKREWMLEIEALLKEQFEKERRDAKAQALNQTVVPKKTDVAPESGKQEGPMERISSLFTNFPKPHIPRLVSTHSDTTSTSVGGGSQTKPNLSLLERDLGQDEFLVKRAFAGDADKGELTVMIGHVVTVFEDLPGSENIFVRLHPDAVTTEEEGLLPREVLRTPPPQDSPSAEPGPRQRSPDYETISDQVSSKPPDTTQPLPPTIGRVIPRIGDEKMYVICDYHGNNGDDVSVVFGQEVLVVDDALDDEYLVRCGDNGDLSEVLLPRRVLGTYAQMMEIRADSQRSVSAGPDILQQQPPPQLQQQNPPSVRSSLRKSGLLTSPPPAPPVPPPPPPPPPTSSGPPGSLKLDIAAGGGLSSVLQNAAGKLKSPTTLRSPMMSPMGGGDLHAELAQRLKKRHPASPVREKVEVRPVTEAQPTALPGSRPASGDSRSSHSSIGHRGSLPVASRPTSGGGRPPLHPTLSLPEANALPARSRSPVVCLENVDEDKNRAPILPSGVRPSSYSQTTTPVKPAVPHRPKSHGAKPSLEKFRASQFSGSRLTPLDADAKSSAARGPRPSLIAAVTGEIPEVSPSTSMTGSTVTINNEPVVHIEGFGDEDVYTVTRDYTSEAGGYLSVFVGQRVTILDTVDEIALVRVHATNTLEPEEGFLPREVLARPLMRGQNEKVEEEEDNVSPLTQLPISIQELLGRTEGGRPKSESSAVVSPKPPDVATRRSEPIVSTIRREPLANVLKRRSRVQDRLRTALYKSVFLDLPESEQKLDEGKLEQLGEVGIPYVAIDKWSAADNGQLSLFKGQSVNVLDQSMKDWWLIRLDVDDSQQFVEGWVPANHLAPVEKPEAEGNLDAVTEAAAGGPGADPWYEGSKPPDQENEPVVGAIYVVKFDFTAESDDALSVKEGEQVQLQSTSGEWWYVSRVTLATGESDPEQGWVPASYLLSTVEMGAEETDAPSIPGIRIEHHSSGDGDDEDSAQEGMC